MGEFPNQLDVNAVPPEYQKKGPDWYAISNPQAGGSFDVRLVHILAHERCVAVLARARMSVFTNIYRSVVCCVRFSSDGRFLATGCNRSAQIYDVETGGKVW